MVFSQFFLIFSINLILIVKICSFFYCIGNTKILFKNRKLLNSARIGDLFFKSDFFVKSVYFMTVSKSLPNTLYILYNYVLYLQYS